MISNQLMPAQGALRETEDEKVIELLRSQHPTAAIQLLERFQDRVYGLSKRILSSDADAKDAMLETFVTVLRKWPTFESRSKFSSWVYTIARNQACMMLRRRRRHEDKQVSLDQAAFSHTVQDSGRLPTFADLVPEERPTPDDQLQKLELRGEIRKAIDSLDPIYRDAYRMKEVDGKSLKQIADELDLTEAAVKSRVHRAREQLRCLLAPVYYN